MEDFTQQTPDTPVSPKQPSEPKKKLDLVYDLFEWSSALVGAVIILVLAFALIASVYWVKGESMITTLHEGEMLVISKLFYTPDYGDIVMFSKTGIHVENEETGRQSPLVKRIIAKGGDRITIDYDQNAVYVNGNKIDEPYLWEAMRTNYTIVEDLYVPEGYVFVLGDNRNNSRDSRAHEIGLIDTRYILGRVVFRLTPLNKIGTVG